MAGRLNRVASELNPLLMVVAAGLLILDVTFYLGILASHESVAWRQPAHSVSSTAPSTAHIAPDAHPSPGAARN